MPTPLQPKLLSGGNPQIAKGYGDAPVQAYVAAMPGSMLRTIGTDRAFSRSTASRTLVECGSEDRSWSWLRETCADQKS
jgi:hypothetical protein